MRSIRPAELVHTVSVLPSKLATHLPNLQHLSLHNLNDIKPSFIADLTLLPNLNTLSLSTTWAVKLESLLPISLLTRLTHLDLVTSSTITLPAYALVPLAPRLQSLALRYMAIDQAHYLCLLTSLTKLELHGSCCKLEELSDIGDLTLGQHWVQVGQVVQEQQAQGQHQDPQHQHLSHQHHEIMGHQQTHQLTPAAGNSTTQAALLSSGRPSPAASSSLARLQRLQHLVLPQEILGDAEMAMLSQLRNLTHLTLYSLDVGLSLWQEPGVQDPELPALLSLVLLQSGQAPFHLSEVMRVNPVQMQPLLRVLMAAPRLQHFSHRCWFNSHRCWSEAGGPENQGGDVMLFREVAERLGQLQRYDPEDGSLGLLIKSSVDALEHDIFRSLQYLNGHIRNLKIASQKGINSDLNIEALASSLPMLHMLDMERSSVSMGALASLSHFSHLKSLILHRLPEPTASSIFILESLGSHLTSLIFTAPSHNSLGLPPWLDLARSPTFPALSHLSWCGSNPGLMGMGQPRSSMQGGGSSNGSSQGELRVTDLHYLLHAAPNLTSLGLYMSSVSIGICNSR